MPTVLVVDDSPTARLALRRALEADSDLAVVAEADSGRAALRLIERHDPQLVTLDVHLKGEDGVEVAAEIMARCPRPILIVTGVDPNDPDLAFRAMNAGALEVTGKLPGSSSPTYEQHRRRLVRTVRALARVPVVTRRRQRVRPQPKLSLPAQPRRSKALADCEVVVIGASTGGPPVLEQILSALPAPFPVPIAIVQHIATGFGAGMAHWLQATTGHATVLCDRSRAVGPAHVYLASDDRHLCFGSTVQLRSVDKPPRNFQRPSINELFESAAACFGNAVVGVLLTGMGNDGVEGLATLRDAGGLALVQAPQTCAVSGMPGAAIDNDCVDYLLTPEQIASYLVANVTGRHA